MVFKQNRVYSVFDEVGFLCVHVQAVKINYLYMMTHASLLILTILRISKSVKTSVCGVNTKPEVTFQLPEADGPW